MTVASGTALGSSSSIPKKAANFGQRCRHRVGSPLATLKAWLAAFGSRAAQTAAAATCSAVRDVLERAVAALAAREPEREAQLLRDRRVDRDGHHEVHRVPDGEAGDEGRDEVRPGPGPTALLLAQQVLLVVVEVRRQVPRVVFPHRGPARPPLHAVHLGAGHQDDALERGRGARDGVDDVRQHGLVRADLVAPVRLPLVGRVEHMRDVRERSQLAFAIARVEEVDREGLLAAGRHASRARHAQDGEVPPAGRGVASSLRR